MTITTITTVSVLNLAGIIFGDFLISTILAELILAILKKMGIKKNQQKAHQKSSRKKEKYCIEVEEQVYLISQLERTQN
jgi:uncharacterized membrane protein